MAQHLAWRNIVSNIYNQIAMSEIYDNRRFVIFSITEVNTIDFTQVYETSFESMKKSADGTQTFVKYDLPQPSSVAALTTKSQEYTYEEIRNLLNTPEWAGPMITLPPTSN